jgi:surface protein
MSFMFYKSSSFNQDISNWDVKNVTDMKGMFSRAYSFKGNDISKWNVKNVRDMEGMFYKANAFKEDISKWDVSSVKNGESMFNVVTFWGLTIL